MAYYFEIGKETRVVSQETKTDLMPTIDSLNSGETKEQLLFSVPHTIVDYLNSPIKPISGEEFKLKNYLKKKLKSNKYVKKLEKNIDFSTFSEDFNPNFGWLGSSIKTKEELYETIELGLKKLIEMNDKSFKKRNSLINLGKKMYGGTRIYEVLFQGPMQLKDNDTKLIRTAFEIYSYIESEYMRNKEKPRPLSTNELKRLVMNNKHSSKKVSSSTFWNSLKFLRNRGLLKKREVETDEKGNHYVLGEKGKGIHYFKNAICAHEQLAHDPRSINDLSCYFGLNSTLSRGYEKLGPILETLLEEVIDGRGTRH